MNKMILVFACLFLGSGISMAQSRAYGVKGGFTIGTQKWEGQDQDPLFGYHGALSIESVSEVNSFGLFAQIGYHVKGSAWRNVFFGNLGNSNLTRSTRKFKFENTALVLGFKRKFKETSGGIDLYYLLGIRGDYTVRTNLGEYEDENIFIGGPVYPFPEGVRKFNYGATVGAGAKFEISEFVSGILELSISPDFTDQYRQATFTANINQNGSVSPRTFRERKIRNLVFEISAGFNFLHKIEYVD